MKKLLVFAVTLIAMNGMAFASLPPLWQNVAELKAILNDKQLEDLVDSGEVIEEIKKTEEGWILITNHQKLPIHVIYASLSKPGPAQFTLEFGTSLAH